LAKSSQVWRHHKKIKKLGGKKKSPGSQVAYKNPIKNAPKGQEYIYLFIYLNSYCPKKFWGLLPDKKKGGGEHLVHRDWTPN
jgi:hypothetical protein